MTASPTSRTVLVTGAAGGMCAGINQRLAAAGHTVLCADLHLEAAQAAADRLDAQGYPSAGYALDVTDDASVQALWDAVTADGHAVEVLVNAAGILDRKFMEDTSSESFRLALEINLEGPFRLIRAFSPAMVEAGWGRIINISSIAGVTGYPYPSYAASKAGLSNLTRSLTVDLRRTGVTINSICPGVVDTPMVIQAVRDEVERKVPTGKIIDPEEIGALAAFLVSDDARSINGADLLIDGGATRVYQLIED
ncbi:MAG: SDR family oxidoreductase [Arthrobacter sp.]|jgi:3-oxoacyl-[acyl-carrier protein] reductase|nr:SDR family oxidoreductase [Arthrobacter sp.]